MPFLALSMILSAAFLHAGWNLLVKSIAPSGSARPPGAPDERTAITAWAMLVPLLPAALLLIRAALDARAPAPPNAYAHTI
ncbi:MAG: hypothetical protein ACKOC5_13160, partial [Chloroflexota bacterium]